MTGCVPHRRGAPRPLTPYERANPTVSFRIPAEKKAQWERLRTEHPETYASLIVKAIDVIDGRLLAERDEYTRGLKVGQDLGRSEGKGIVTIRCCKCGKSLEINTRTNSEVGKEVREALAHWGHGDCINRAPAPLADNELPVLIDPIPIPGPFNTEPLTKMDLPGDVVVGLKLINLWHERVRRKPGLAYRVMKEADPRIIRTIPRAAMPAVAWLNLIRYSFSEKVAPLTVPFVPESVEVVEGLQRSSKEVDQLRSIIAENFTRMVDGPRSGKDFLLLTFALAQQILRKEILLCIRDSFLKSQRTLEWKRVETQERINQMADLKDLRGRPLTTV